MSAPYPSTSTHPWLARLLARAPRDPIVVATWLVVVGVLLVAMRDVGSDPTRLMWGQHLDTVYHAWGVWWAGATEGHHTDLVSFPAGEHGSLLAPLTAALVQPIAWVGGTALAYNAMNLVAMLGSVVGLAVLARTLGVGPRATALSALLFAGARPLVGQGALGTVEGAVLGPLFLACAAAVVWPRRSLGFGALVGGLFAVSVIENPYTLVPGGVLAAVFALQHGWRARSKPPGDKTRVLLDIALAAVTGAGIVGLRLALAGGDVGGNLPAAWSTTVAGMQVAVVDPTAFPFEALLRPTPSPDLASATNWISTSGWLHWPGWLVFVFALLARPFPRWLGVLALLGFGLALGSVPLGTESAVYGPFFWLNVLLQKVAHPLTQPFRFLPMAVGATALVAGLGIQRVLTWRPGVALALLAVITLEAGALGAPAVRTGATSMRPHACWASLRDTGPVHLVPLNEEAPRGQLPPNAVSMLWQLVHEQPSTAGGIGGWTRVPQSETWSHALQTLQHEQRRWDRSHTWARALGQLEDHGVRTIILHQQTTTGITVRPRAECLPWRAFSVSELRRALDNPHAHGGVGARAEPPR